jgi:hypothetical protein
VSRKVFITGANDDPVYLERMRALCRSAGRNSPDTELHAFHFGKLDRIHAAHHRSSHLVTMMATPGVKAVGWLDCDMLVRKPLKHLWDDVKPNVLKVLYRPTQDDPFKFNTGCMLVGVGPATAHMIRDWHQSMERSTEFFDDQLYLWQAYLRMKGLVKLVPLDEKYNDCHFNPESVIWHAKGNSAIKYPGWDEEYTKYV